MILIAKVSCCPNTCDKCEAVSRTFFNNGKIISIDKELPKTGEKSFEDRLISSCPLNLISIRVTL